MEFERRRGEFKSKWFPSLNIQQFPLWYRMLYYTEKEIVVEFFNRYRYGIRLTWQGTGYCQSYNAEYRRIALSTVVYVSMISQGKFDMQFKLDCCLGRGGIRFPLRKNIINSERTTCFLGIRRISIHSLFTLQSNIFMRGS